MIVQQIVKMSISLENAHCKVCCEAVAAKDFVGIVNLNIPSSKPHNKRKTVSFDDEHLEIIIEFEDDNESKSSRETYWEMQARDRARFQDRVLRTGDILDRILLPGHRFNIYQQRFVTADSNPSTTTEQSLQEAEPRSGTGPIPPNT